MNSNDPNDLLELASAYLDNQVTSAERARVEATPELRALVASLRDVSTLIAAVSPAGAAVREAAVASAMAEFDTGAGEGSLVSPPVSLASRRRWPNSVLSAAAAVVLLGVVGISVLNNTSRDSSDNASRAPQPKFETNTADDAVGAGVPETAGGEILQAAESPLIIENPEQLRMVTVSLPPTADTTAAADSTERVSYNLDALACMDDDQVFLADIYYQGKLAIAVRDTVTGVTEAIDDTCTVLASVAP